MAQVRACHLQTDNFRAHITSPTMTVNILCIYLELLNAFSLILQQHCPLEPLSTKLLKETMDIISPYIISQNFHYVQTFRKHTI